MKKYSIRQPGCTSYSDVATLREAKKELRDAIKMNGDIGYIIVNNKTGEII